MSTILNFKISVLKNILKTLLCIAFYYVFSIGITFYNKWMFSRFHFPISTTMVHFTMTFLLAGVARRLLTCYYKKKRVALSWDVFLTKVLPTGIISALDIGLSNWSFMFITVSLYTMVKSSCILWILFFSLIMGLEKPRWNLFLIVLCIAFGLFLFVFKSTQFNLEGFILVLLASFLGGARWTLSQVLCQKAELGLTNPIDTVYHLTPTMIIGLFPIFIGHETSFLLSEFTFNSDSMPDFIDSLLLICTGGILAFWLTVSEYLLLSVTSSLTLSISGILKELCTLLIATQVGNDKLTPTNWLGFLICICGISVHVYNKYQRLETGEDELCSGNSNVKPCLTDLSSKTLRNEERSGLMDTYMEDSSQNTSESDHHLETRMGSRHDSGSDPVMLTKRARSIEQSTAQALRGEEEGFDSIPLN